MNWLTDTIWMIHLNSTLNRNVRRDTKALVCSRRPHQPCEVADDWAVAHKCQPLSSRDHRDTEGCKHLDVDAWCGSPRACWPGRLCLLCAEDPAAPDTAAAMWACVQGGERGNKKQNNHNNNSNDGAGAAQGLDFNGFCQNNLWRARQRWGAGDATAGAQLASVKMSESGAK